MKSRIGKILAFAVCLCFALACIGCGAGDPVSSGSANIGKTGEKTTGKWVVEMYICGTDLESQGGAATSDLEELTKNRPPEGVTFVIQAGGAKKWENKDIKRKKINRFVYDKDGLRAVETKPDADMAATDTFAKFLKYAQENYEADHRILIVWDHGGGTVGGARYGDEPQPDAGGHGKRLPERREKTAV